VNKAQDETFPQEENLQEWSNIKGPRPEEIFPNGMP